MYQPIQLHPDNPHYFLFRGKPTILYTSAEHYSMVMNRNFDYIKYLDTLVSCGFNHSRVYTGVKRERPGDYNIDGNALAVSAEDFVGPWKRTDIPGCLDGGNKYDLDQWDEEYFTRFKDILTEAGKRNIEIEIILHGPLHMGWDGVGPWGVCPLNIANNINDVGDLEYPDVNSLKDPKMVEYQDRYVRKLVTELNEFDNLHYEICNEPYTYPTTTAHYGNSYDSKVLRLEWQQHVADVVHDCEDHLPQRHLISCNFLSGFALIDRPLNHVDLYCFHYIALSAIKRNYHLQKAIGMNETGIQAKPDYPKQAWMTILSGLSLYNMLDYTYIPGYEDGSYDLLSTNPAYTGITGAELRAKLRIVNDFIKKFKFMRMKPANELLIYDTGVNVEYQLLAEENEQYAMFHEDTQHSGATHGVNVGFKAADGDYNVEIMEADTGKVLLASTVAARNERLSIFYEDITRSDGNHPFRIAISAKKIH